MAKKKTSKKVAKKATKKKTTPKAEKKVPTTKIEKNIALESSITTPTPKIEDTDDEEVLPVKLEGDDLKKEIKELESVDSGKKNLSPLKKPGRGGTRRVKPKHVVTARKPTGGLKLAPGVMITGKSTNTEEQPKKCPEQEEFRRLTQDELKETRKKLIELRERILENMRKEIADYRQRASSTSADPVDQAADAYDDDVTFEIAANHDEELEQIDSALEKIEKGTYGLCEMCSVTISPSRLKILPFATRCVNCRENYEKTKIKKEVTTSWAFLEGEETEESSS